ncbi:Golgi-associated kinase 1B [Polymixia lowei]
MDKFVFHWPFSSFLRLTGSFRRCPPSRRNLIIAVVCFVYLFFMFSQVGHSWQQRDRRIDRDKYRRSRGLYNLGINEAQSETVDSTNGANTDSAVPTRSNVVYITLRSKRQKPAIIRGTIRPKLRRKARRIKSDHVAFTQNKADTLERTRGQTRTFGPKAPWKEIRDIDYRYLDVGRSRVSHTDPESLVSSIRIYSEKAPPWFSAEDVSAMRFLADAKVSRIKEISYKGSPSFLLFESETKNVSSTNVKEINHHGVCGGKCGLIKRPVDTSEVFAFHLDRVLGLNRTLPAVSRKFSMLHDGQPCPVVSLDASVYPEGLVSGQSTVSLTWGEYQSSLKQKCWHKNITPKPDSGCSPIHHYEWSKLALFDFLLQIYNRLDRSCCGFKPRREDVCVELDHHAECRDQNHIALANIIHRGHDPRHLVYTNNKGFFDRNEDNLDFRLLDGIKELPEKAVAVLRSKRLREKLLQSLFLDQTYWESQGGRQGIDKLIDVIERRAKVLLTYTNAHGIKVIAMNV